MSIHEAIVSLRPGIEFTMQNDDVTTIDWVSLGVDPVTQIEAQTEASRLKQQRIDSRNSAIAHAKSLGFTDAMIAVMYPNLVEA